MRRYMPLARSLARRYGRSSEPFEDLLQVASLGLLKALDRYDPSRGFAFKAFAVPTVLGEMRRYFRDSGWAVHVPRSVQERSLKVRGAQEHLTNQEGRAPTVSGIAQYLELDTEDVIDALQAIQSYETVSLDAPAPGGDEDASSYGDSLGDEDERYELVELVRTVASVMNELPAARAADPAHALRRGPDPVGDSGPGRCLPDAGLAPAAALSGGIARPDSRPSGRGIIGSGATRRRARRGQTRGSSSLVAIDQIMSTNEPNVRLKLSNRPENVALVRAVLVGVAEATNLDAGQLDDIEDGRHLRPVTTRCYTPTRGARAR